MALGIAAFILGGICAANSIEAKESKLVEKLFSIVTVLGFVAFVIGILGQLIID
jgi:hypothetical protein